jgi:hypothetical protein
MIDEKNDVIETKQHFINEENFKLLKQCQQEIFEITEVSPSLRKIVNELINDENLHKLKSKFITTWSN